MNLKKQMSGVNTVMETLRQDQKILYEQSKSL
jgi:hypothetical protein